ncbi:MAG: hypothetical protein ACLFNC_02795 [Halodesulfurarchaeum sp.]
MHPSIVAVIIGTAGALFPEAIINWTKRVILGPSFENAAELQPRSWYVSAVRLQSVVVVLAGIAWLAFERRQSLPVAPSTADLTPGDE